MMIVEQPNSWSCVPASFSTVTGVPLATLLECIGHDGSEIIFPDLSDPYRRRGFHSQEVIRALVSFGFLFATFEFQPVGFLDETHHYQIEEEEAVLELMADSIGVVAGTVVSSGNLHAVAWDGTHCYDPMGFIYPLDLYKIQVFYRLGRC